MFLFLPFMMILSCDSGPEPLVTPDPAPVAQVQTPAQETPPPVQDAPPEPVQAPAEEAGFNPDRISQETYDTTMSEIQQLVGELNGIIRARNYNSWLTYLSEEYRNEINSREFLNELVQTYPAFRGRINNARDYFTNVVVPSHANDHVDDIEFVSENRVKAYTIFVAANGQRERAVLYDLELIDGKWKIIN